MRSSIKAGFTLLEVNLAVLILSAGVLGLCALYSMGYRENRQSKEDVAVAGYADAILAPLVNALSATNVTWDAWTSLGATIRDEASDYGVADAVWPSSGAKHGWECYVDVDTSDRQKFRFSVNRDCNGMARKVFDDVNTRLGTVDHKGGFPGIDNKYFYGLVLSRRGPLIQLSVKISRRREDLMATSMFVSEVRYQGDPERNDQQ